MNTDNGSDGTNLGTLAAVFSMCIVPFMAENRTFGEMAEWFKAAVLKTAPENTAHPRISARLVVFRRRSTRVHGPFAKNIPAQRTAQ